MNLKKNTLLIVSGLAVGLLAAPSLAQVAPPPTKPAKEQPTYTPPAATPKPAAQTPSTPKPKTQINAKRDSGDVATLPIDVPYPKLAQTGPNGRILRLRQLPDILALRSNPNVGPVSVEKIMPIIYSRRYRFELMVIDNLDLYWELSAGLIENLDMSNMTEMGRIAQMLKPLVGETTLSQELLNRGILTRVQGGMNQYIVREYKKAITDEIQVLDGDSGLDGVMRFVLDDSIHEAGLAYSAMIAEASYQIDELVDETDATSEEAQALKAMVKPLADTPEQQFVDMQAFDAAFRTLSYEEAMNILKAMREKRKFPSLSPMIKKIDVLHDRKQVMKGDGMKLKVKTGEELRKEHRRNKNANKEAPEG